MPSDLTRYPEIRTTLKIGDRIEFLHESQPYRVRAISSDRRFAICTKPFNLRKTVIYSIIDFVTGRRAPDDRVFCCGYETEEQIAERMCELEAGKIGLSRRHDAPLMIVRVLPPARRAA